MDMPRPTLGMTGRHPKNSCTCSFF